MRHILAKRQPELVHARGRHAEASRVAPSTLAQHAVPTRAHMAIAEMVRAGRVHHVATLCVDGAPPAAGRGRGGSALVGPLGASLRSGSRFRLTPDLRRNQVCTGVRGLRATC